MSSNNNKTKNPSNLADCPDIVSLIYCEEDDVIENLRLRHKKNKIYTSICDIMLAVNPYQSLSIYGSKFIEESYNCVINGESNNNPHLYQLSARSFLFLSSYKENQSIIVSGESGSGKTESSKRLMEALTINTHSIKKNLANEILKCNPILEAFGNAKTVMNNNSSRFGKFTKILFENDKDNDNKLTVVGAKISTYLLEKSRIITQGNNERNYHIFYLLFNAQKDNDDFNFNLSSDIKSYFYLYGNGNGNVQSINIENRNDYNYYIELKQAMNDLGFENKIIHEIYNAIAAILHLGQISFYENDKGYAQIKNNINDDDVLCNLLGIDKESLIKRLQEKSIKVGTNIIYTNLNIEQAFENRDEFCQCIYQYIYNYLVNHLSNRLSDNDMDDSDDIFIGILDIFGFESFDNNSLEQLCINFCNEQLQEYFNFSIIITEQNEYLKQGLNWKQINIESNENMVKLISNKKNGIFSLIDSANLMPKGTVDAFYDSLWRNHSKNKLLQRSKNKKYKFNFKIIHYAQIVEYNSSLFLDKNHDTIHQDTLKLLQQSKNNTIASMLNINNKSIKKNSKHHKKSFQGVGTHFNKQLEILMHDLKHTKSHFLRCLNPNKSKSKTEWNESHVRRQLKCNGIIEAIKVIKLGYPSRTQYQYILDKFDQYLIKNIKNFDNLTNRKKVECIMNGLNVDKKDFELGFTKIFFKPNSKNILIDIEKHSNTFNKNEINKIKKSMILSKSSQINGLLRSYFRLSNIFLFKLQNHKIQSLIYQMLVISKFKSSCNNKREIISGNNDKCLSSLSSSASSTEYSSSSDYESSSEYISSSESNDNDNIKNKRSATQKKIAMLVKAWSLNSVLGETFLKYGRKGFPHERTIQIDIMGKKLLWGTGSISIRKIKEIRPGITTEILKKHESSSSSAFDKDLYLSIITNDRSLDLKATRKGQRNVWCASLRLLSGKSKAAKLFRKMRKSWLKQQMIKQQQTTKGTKQQMLKK